MNNPEWDGLEPGQSKLRALTGRFGLELERLRASVSGEERGGLDRLASIWQELTTSLALGEEPALRGCPHCRRQVLQQATRCRYCMRHFDSVAATR